MMFYFLAKFIQNFMELWFIPVVLDLLVGLILWKIEKGQSLRKIIAKTLKWFPIIIFVSTLFITIVSNKDSNPNPKEDISITDISFDAGVRGLASLYDDNIMPIWFESDLDDVWLDFMIDNTGTSYVDIKNTRLIIDDFQPVSMDDILLFREEAFAGVPTKASADIDLTDIKIGRSEYDVRFTAYNDYNTGTTIPLERGQTFNVEQSSQTRLVTFLGMKKSGIYTYHLEANYEYYRKTGLMETIPVSFIYIDGDSKDYQYDYERLNSFHMNRICEDEYTKKIMYYTIDGRTLRIHDTGTIYENGELCEYFSLITDIIVEDGTKEIEAYAFGSEAGLYNTRTMYLPQSLEYLDVDCFYFNDGHLKTICFGGTEEKWDYLIHNSQSDRFENIEDVEIIFDCDVSTYEEILKSYPEENDEDIFPEKKEADHKSISIITGEGKKSGICSASIHDNVKWKLTDVDGNMTLTITGSGDMASFDDTCSGPWGESRQDIKRIIIEDGVTSIGNYAFIDFENLSDVSIAESVASIGNIAFWGCWSLESIAIPNGVKDIGDASFAYCYSMRSISLPDSITSIGEWAFDYCYNIGSILIPKNVNIVGESAFYACSGMKEIHFMGSAPEFGENVFSEVIATAYYPKNDDTWTDSAKQQYGGVIEWIETDENNQEKSVEETREDKNNTEIILCGWGSAEKSPSIRYDAAETELENLLELYGKGKTKLDGFYEIKTQFSTWQENDTYSSSLRTLSSVYTAKELSDFGLLYVASDDYDGDGIADLIGFRTETVPDVSGNQQLCLRGQFNTFGKTYTTHNFSDTVKDCGEISFIVVNHHLIKIKRDYGVGGLWPLSEEEVDENDLTFTETIEVMDMGDLFNDVFYSERNVGNYLPNYILETPNDRYYWNTSYSTSEDVSLHEIKNEDEMTAIIENKLTDLVGEPVVSLLNLRWDNRWAAISFLEPSSVLQINTVFNPVTIKEQEGGNIRIGSGDFTVITTVPGLDR